MRVRLRRVPFVAMKIVTSQFMAKEEILREQAGGFEHAFNAGLEIAIGGLNRQPGGGVGMLRVMPRIMGIDAAKPLLDAVVFRELESQSEIGKINASESNRESRMRPGQRADHSVRSRRWRKVLRDIGVVRDFPVRPDRLRNRLRSVRIRKVQKNPARLPQQQ